MRRRPRRPNRSSVHDLERRIVDFNASVAPHRAHDRVLEAAIATIDTTPQRRAFIRAPLWDPDMNTVARFATAVLAVSFVRAIPVATTYWAAGTMT
jgi:hypothetical protein